MIRKLEFELPGSRYGLAIEDYGDSESSDTVEIYGPGEELLSSYDSCLVGDAAVIAEAKRELEAVSG